MRFAAGRRIGLNIPTLLLRRILSILLAFPTKAMLRIGLFGWTNRRRTAGYGSLSPRIPLAPQSRMSSITTLQAAAISGTETHSMRL
jgi:hypothetical protein